MGSVSHNQGTRVHLLHQRKHQNLGNNRLDHIFLHNQQRNVHARAGERDVQLHGLQLNDVRVKGAIRNYLQDK